MGAHRLAPPGANATARSVAAWLTPTHTGSVPAASTTPAMTTRRSSSESFAGLAEHAEDRHAVDPAAGDERRSARAGSRYRARRRARTGSGRCSRRPRAGRSRSWAHRSDQRRDRGGRAGRRPGSARRRPRPLRPAAAGWPTKSSTTASTVRAPPARPSTGLGRAARRRRRARTPPRSTSPATAPTWAAIGTRTPIAPRPERPEPSRPRRRTAGRAARSRVTAANPPAHSRSVATTPVGLGSPDGGLDPRGEPGLVGDHAPTVPPPRRQRVAVGRGRRRRRVVGQVVERPDLEDVDRRAARSAGRRSGPGAGRRRSSPRRRVDADGVRRSGAQR